MSLQNFDLIVTDIKILPETVVANSAHRYGNTSNVVYSVDITAQGYKSNTIGKIEILNVPIQYTTGNTGNNFIAFANLTPTMVSSWAANSLIQMNGANAITTLETQVEAQIDAEIARKNPPKPNLPWNK